MAELEDAPWAVKKQEGISITPVPSEGLPDAPWEAGPGTVEDTAKTLGPSLLRGSLAAITTPRTISDLTGQGVNWAINKLAPDTKAAELANRFHAADTGVGGAFPSYDQLRSETERDITGPLYEAKTPVGKGAQVAAEVLPSMLGGGALPAIAKSVGAGVGSAGLGETAHALRDYLPAWAEPVARGVGALGGTALPSVARRAVTPLPMAVDQAATVAALKAKDPLFPMSAGQETGSPKLMALEARAPKMQALLEKQVDAFTRGTMKEMGVDGLSTPENIAKGKDIGDRIGAIRRGNEITPAEFPQLNKDISSIVKRHAGVVGKDNAALLTDLQNEIRLGASNNTNVASMPGARYNYMRQRLQGAIDSAGTGTESKALSKVRETLDNAFHRSISKDQSAELKKLETQYANYNVLKNKTPTGEDVLTPKEVAQAVAKGFGNAAVNENKGTLAPWARNASKVVTEFPKPNLEGGPLSKTIGGLAGLLGGGAAGYSHGGVAGALAEGGLFGILGGERANDLVQVLKNAGGRAAASTPAQAYLKNQLWQPGAATGNDAATIARLLLTPPEKQMLSDQSR